MTTEHKLPNKEECTQSTDCPIHKGGYECPISPSDKTWDKTFFEKFGANKIWVSPSRDNVETVHEIYFFIQELLTSATIKAKEEVLRGLILERIDVGPSVKNEVKHVLAIEVLEYAKSLGINLEEPIKVKE